FVSLSFCSFLFFFRLQGTLLYYPSTNGRLMYQACYSTITILAAIYFITVGTASCFPVLTRAHGDETLCVQRAASAVLMSKPHSAAVTTALARHTLLCCASVQTLPNWEAPGGTWIVGTL
ncbi:unnamed protein product, partial [Pylaiella littoralis]